MATVTISQGSLRGGKSVTDSGFEYYEFLGIPYAKPPVGDLRFKSPQSPDPWETERDATKCDPSNISCQLDIINHKIAGSEDCLYLNVYTPLLDTSKAPLPVVVYIHGGGFFYGNGILKETTGPDYLLESNVVVVTINYRLGVLGFLSLDIPEAAGNMGLKDQVKALEWVRDNISLFGGDYKNVTVFGLSAGAASIDHLIVSPRAKGLFHKAILQSGSILNHWALNFKHMDLAQLYLQLLDYKGSLEDKKSMHEFLMNKTTDELVKASFSVAEQFCSERISFGFVPIIEKDFGNNDAILTASPYALLKAGNFNHVPVLRGFCNKEGVLTLIMKGGALNKIMEEKNFANVWPFEIDSSEKELINNKFNSVYLDKLSDDNIVDLLEDFFSDIDFVAGIWITSKYLSRKVPVHMYQFSYEGTINYLKKTFGLQRKGTLHGDDSTYVIKNYAEIFKNPDDVDISVRKRMVKMFTDFVKTGEPIPVPSTDVKKIVKMFSEITKIGKNAAENTDVSSYSWEQFTEATPVYLSIDKECSMLENYEPEKIAIFEKLYEKFYG